MNKLIIALVVLAVLAAGCGQEQVAGGTNGDNLTGAAIKYGEASYFLGEPVVYKNVAVVPLTSTTQDQQRGTEYVTLAEATKNDWIEIIEKPGNETVSELTVRYTGPRPLLLLAGELLLGGKQDRVVAKDFVIEPSATVVVPVFCVEPGRWSGSTLSFRSSGTQVPVSVKKRVLMQDQGEVWAGTGEFNSMAGLSLGRSTVDAGLSSRRVVEFTKAGRDRLKAAIAGDGSTVGVIFVIDGKIRSMEIFSSHRVLDASFDSILGGILAEAAVSDSEDAGLPSRDALQAFLAEALEAQTLASASGIPTDGIVEISGYSRSVGGAAFFGAQLSEADVEQPVHSSFINKED